jgi:hypothetical protein
MISTFVSFLAIFSATAHADRDAGEAVDEALILDVTESGFAAISEALPAFVPSSIPVPDVRQTGRALYDWELLVTGMKASAEVRSAQLRPGDGHLDVTAQTVLRLNSESDRARVRFIYKAPGWLGGPWTLTDCRFYLEPVTIDIATRAYVSVVPNADGVDEIDVTMGTVDWSWSLRGSNLKVSSCPISTLEEIANFVGLSFFDLLVDPLEGLVNDQIQALVRDLGPEIEGALNSLVIDETFAFNGAEMSVRLQPSAAQVVPEGMRITMTGVATADEHPCIAGNGITASRSTASAPPRIGEHPDGVEPHDIGIIADDDFVNQALFAVYRAGAMCFDLEGSQGEIPLNTNVLGLLAPGAFDPLFPKPQPIRIEVRPTQPPEAAPTGPFDVTVEARELQLDIYAEVDGRQAAIVGVDLDLTAGVDLEFDGTTGGLQAQVTIGGDNLTARGRPNEFVPGVEDQVASRIGGLFDSLAAPLLGDALSGLSFALPSFGGFGLARLDAAATGSAGEHFGFFAGAGLVPYGSGGCGDEGCGGSDGCDQGCNPMAASGRGLALVVLPLTVAMLRRRRLR